MQSLPPTRRYHLLLGTGAFLFTIALIVLATATGTARPRRSASISIGLPMRGALKKGEVLPTEGAGYRLRQLTRERRARFGVSELIMMIKQATFQVHKRYKGAKLAVGDLSLRKGGRFSHHASHQNGRDVDLLFYVLNNKDQSITPKEMITFDKNGYSITPPMTYRFDDRRNWALLEQLLKSSFAHVQYIFVADYLKARILAEAEAQHASPRLIRQAKQILRQPRNSAHNDHFHVRIYCPSNDLPACRDQGPRWAWVPRGH